MASRKCLWLASIASLWTSGTVSAAPVAVPDAMMEVVLDRRAASAILRVESRTAFIVRAERDLTRVRVELAPTDGVRAAGRWSARLLALPRTEKMDAPDLSRVSMSDTVWDRTDSVPAARSFSTSLNLALPRPVYQSWLLVVEPRDSASAVELRLTGVPLHEGNRVEWLTRMRISYDPAKELDRVRDLVVRQPPIDR